jgi:tetratricopeptide (TPR) repeat protein
MSDWPPRLLREAALEKVEAQLVVSPEDAEARFRRSCLLTELGRTEEAKAAYLELLARAPDHFGALNNFGNLVYGLGFKKAAQTLYSRAIALHPDNPKGHVNLANLLVENHDIERAIEHYEAALRLDPDHVEANRGLAYLLTQSRDEQKAAVYRQKAFQGRPLLSFPYCGEGTPVSLLVLVSAMGGGIPMRHHFDERVFLVSALFVEFYDHSTPLPPHQLVINTIGDADLCRPALQAAIKIAAKTKAPIINQPSNVLHTGRVENADRLGRIPGVVTPKIALLSRTVLENSEAVSLLARQGFTFPLLLRSPGFHTGQFFEHVQDEKMLATSLSQMPGKELMVIQYLDARSPDGKIRKYRVMMIDGVLYPLHAAISHEWKIHYFTAEMADNPEHRAEDAAFLDDMPRVLGDRAMKALSEICRTLGLDYGGIDFSVSSEGDILLFEANATMIVLPTDKDPRWDYRRPAVQRILDAVQRLLTRERAAG